MSSPWKTGLIEEALDALPEIGGLASETLAPDKLKEVNSVAEMLSGPKVRKIHGRCD